MFVEGATASPTAAVRASSASAVRGIIVHHHASPMTGIGLMAFGVILYVLYAFLAYLGPLMGMASSGLGPDDVAVLQFSGFLLLAVGAILGLAAVRHRE